MISVAVVGLGAMGTALARAQLNAGHATTVWNRSPAKAELLVGQGAALAETASEAVRAAEITLVCVDTYASAEAALAPLWSEGVLAGRIIVQVGTGSPDEARAFAERVEAAGGQALDGAIMFYPSEVGPEGTELLMIGGPEAAYRAAEPALRQISGRIEYLGENIAAPATLDLAMLSISVPLYAGVAHAARICESEGADVSDLARLARHGALVTNRLEVIAAGAFPLNSLHDGGSLAVWADVAKGALAQAKARGINAEIPAFMAGLYARAVAEGHGPEDVTALIKLLRKG